MFGGEMRRREKRESGERKVEKEKEESSEGKA